MSTRPLPKAILPAPISVPDELQTLDQWVVWKYVRKPDKEKLAKVPYNARTGKQASTSNAATWCSFSDAIDAVLEGDYSGVGFVFSNTDPFIGIDLDGCIIDQVLDPDIQALIDEIGSYAEISVSGTGVHIIARGELPGRGRIDHSRGREMYGRGRYFTFSGDVIGSHKTIESNPEVVNRCYFKWFSSNPAEAIPASSYLFDSDALVSELSDLPIHRNTKRLIETGEGLDQYDNDHSNALFYVVRELVVAGVNNETILTVLTDPSYYLANNGPLAAHRRNGDIESGRRWLWQYNVDPIRRAHNQEIDDFSALDVETTVPAKPDQRIPPKLPMSDLGNAKRFVFYYGENTRYLMDAKKWVHFNDKRWEIDTTGVAERKAKQTALAIYNESRTEPSLERQEKLSKFSIKTQSAAALSALLTLARTEKGIPASVSEFDIDNNLLGTPNGVIELNTGRLRAPQRGDYITRQTNVEINPRGDCPVFKQFLYEVMDGSHAMVDYLQRAIGYTLTGLTTEQVMFFLYGYGANGKSTLLDILQYLFGDYATQCSPDTLMARKQVGAASNDIARLKGARLVCTSETEEGRRFGEAQIKQMTGGDTIVARFLFQEYFEYKPQFKIWLAANHKPIIRGTDAAIWRRIHLIPFNRAFKPEERDPRLGVKLRSEAGAILQWAIKGALAWRREGLAVPEIVSKATNEYRSEMDILLNFTREACEICAGSESKSSELYEAYRRWVANNGHKPLASNKFTVRMQEHGFEKIKRRDGMYFKGIQSLEW